jgi:hypothetical protein
MSRKPVVPTHRATLETGETVDYAGAHPTHWTFGREETVTSNGEKVRQPGRVRTARVVSVAPLSAYPDASYVSEDDEDE